MIKRSLWPGQKLAVGKQEYKDIIEASLVSVRFLIVCKLPMYAYACEQFEHNFCSEFIYFCQGIHCLFDEAVLEVMWGLKNLIKMLVPDEKLELTNEDRLQIR